jgi:hypothetical protein
LSLIKRYAYKKGVFLENRYVSFKF